MTPWCLAPMDITKRWVSALYQTFTAASFSCCLFVGLSASSFVSSKWKTSSIGLGTGGWLGHWRILHCFTLRSSWVVFAVCFGLLSICTVKHHIISSAASVWLWADSIALYTSEFILLRPSAVTSSMKTSEPVQLTALHAHDATITLPPPCLTDEVLCFGSWALPFLLQTFLLPPF